MSSQLTCPEFTYVFTKHSDGSWDLGCEGELRPMLVLEGWEEVLDFAGRLMAEALPCVIVFRKSDELRRHD